MAEKGRVLTGARSRFSIEGRKVGYATNVNGSEEIEYQPVEVLDNIEVSEHVPTAYRATLTASLVRIVGETIKSQNFFPSAGKSTEEHLQNILAQGEMVAMLEDSKTSKTVMTAEQVKIASRNFSVAARGIVGKDINFVLIRMKDESEIAT
jgi:hypothetical protein